MHFSVADSRAEADVAFTRCNTGGSPTRSPIWRAWGSSRSCATAATPARRSSTRSTPWTWCAPGIMTYGLNPSPDTQGVLDLEPMLRLYTTVSQIRSFPAGVDVSYGAPTGRAALGGWRCCPSAMPTGCCGASRGRRHFCSGGGWRLWWAESAWICAWWTSPTSPSPGGRHGGGDLAPAALRDSGRADGHHLL